MGTLGCINDMLQRDKENRALRKLSRGRMREHYKYLVKRKGPERADVTIEEIEEIRRNTTAVSYTHLTLPTICSV